MPVSVAFVDEDIDKGELSGDVHIERATDETWVTFYSLQFANELLHATGEFGRINVADVGSDSLLTFTMPDATTFPEASALAAPQKRACALPTDPARNAARGRD